MRTTAKAAFTAALIIATMWPVGAATAAASPPEAKHCVVTGTAGQVAEASARRCFATFRESIAFATNGKITDAPVSPAQAMNDRDFVERLRLPAAPTPGISAEYRSLGIAYEHVNFGGGSLTFRGSVGCGWRYPEFGQLGDWNDKISSVMPLACNRMVLYVDSDFGGASQPYGASPQLDMNDQASSVSFE
ncbi:peptidase inhibitor family I36 protein [Nonomuraea pusilla]|uniref:Peptidase inhibitor family I36 n=1 Tax=Nonomuraea pusilla TaxID=46177 RepID=A0A1H7WUA6_9ACTN|nr:peptidase inhibitor family I36 protein [Nonomuraea pusilla]SEM25190.1 hypothetical protein SAMN05660976_04606 [Nonomuraea pusilla]